MSQILTIDFDIIMSPSIQLYNDLIGDQKGVNKIIKNYPLLEYTLTGDFFIYEVITRGLIQLFKKINSENIFFISEHQTLVKLTEDMDKFDLINIDHHHDLGYNKIIPTTKIIRPDCGNWAKYLSDKGKINSYIWVCNDNSDMPSNSMSKAYINETIGLELINFSAIDNIDRLIICNSPQWIPPNIQALFMSWVGIAEEFYGKSFNIL